MSLTYLLTCTYCTVRTHTKCLKCGYPTCADHMKNHYCKDQDLAEESNSHRDHVCKSHPDKEALVACLCCFKQFCSSCLNASLSCSPPILLDSSDTATNDRQRKPPTQHQYCTIPEALVKKREVLLDQIDRCESKAARYASKFKASEQKTKTLIDEGHVAVLRAKAESKRLIKQIKGQHEAEISKFEEYLDNLEQAQKLNKAKNKPLKDVLTETRRVYSDGAADDLETSMFKLQRACVVKPPSIIQERRLIVKTGLTFPRLLEVECSMEADILSSQGDPVLSSTPIRLSTKPERVTIANGRSSRTPEPSHKQKYTREFLLSLRNLPLSQRRPVIDCSETAAIMSDKPLYTDQDVTVDVDNHGVPNYPPDFFRTPFQHMGSTVGHIYVAKLWRDNKLSLKEHFLPADEDETTFLNEKGLEWLDTVETAAGSNFTGKSLKDIAKEIEVHFGKPNADNDTVFDLVDDRLSTERRKQEDFIKMLSGCVVVSCVSPEMELNEEKLSARLVIMKKYINTDQHKQQTALNAVKELVGFLKHPRSLLCDIFYVLANDDLISEEAFRQWKEQSSNGMALQSLKSFFKWLDEPVEADQ